MEYPTVEEVLSGLNDFMQAAKALKDSLAIEVELEDSSEEGGEVWIDKLKALRPGEGQKFMKALTELADQEGITLSLNAHPIGPNPPMDKAKLVRWYEGFGFEVDGSQDPQFEYVTMRRLPQRD